MPPAIAFVGFEEAFDSIITLVVIEALKDEGVEPPYIELLENIQRRYWSSKLTGRGLEVQYQWRHQRDSITTNLFAATAGVLRKLIWEIDPGLRMYGESHRLRFLDGFAPLSKCLGIRKVNLRTEYK